MTGLPDAAIATQLAPPTERRRRGPGDSPLRRFVGLVVPPIALFIVLVLLVELVVVAAGIPPFVLASPSAIWGQLVQYAPQVLQATLVTGLNALIGLVIGAVIGVLLAIVASFIRAIDGMLVPDRRRRRRRADRGARPRALHDVRLHIRGGAHHHRLDRRVRPGVPQHAPRPAPGAAGASRPHALLRGHPRGRRRVRSPSRPHCRTSSPACASPRRSP